MAKLESISTGFNTLSWTVVRPGGGGQFNFVDFISGLLFSLEFSHAFSGEFDGMGGVDYAVKDSVSHSRIPHHVVLCRGRILGCDDY